ncbi:hypothetical protein CEXT_789011 [Caerostris extrusa]|uniref:Uncharacterized protein n=1 Tax=Caerostris extrusa TaxID=172846 RepID=A0AAV4MQI3_CAEEX|nr:hypothetical protein CEXT_789011 [Caerostris extrusa]
MKKEKKKKKKKEKEIWDGGKQSENEATDGVHTPHKDTLVMGYFNFVITFLISSVTSMWLISQEDCHLDSMGSLQEIFLKGGGSRGKGGQDVWKIKTSHNRLFVYFGVVVNNRQLARVMPNDSSLLSFSFLLSLCQFMVFWVE